MIDTVAILPGAVLFFSLGWAFRRRTCQVYRLFRAVLGEGAFPDEGPKRDSYERFLRVVGLGFVVFGVLGVFYFLRGILGG